MNDREHFTAITSLSNIQIKLKDYYREDCSFNPQFVKHAIDAMQNMTGHECHMFIPKDKHGAMPMIILGDNDTQDPPVYIIAPRTNKRQDYEQI